MTRMDIDPDDPDDLDASARRLCPEHLTGNHNECHQLAGYLRGATPDGHLRKLLGHAARGQVDLTRLRDWHDALEREARRRGYEWDSPLDVTVAVPIGDGAITASATQPVEVRCGECGGVSA